MQAVVYDDQDPFLGFHMAEAATLFPGGKILKGLSRAARATRAARAAARVTGIIEVVDDAARGGAAAVRLGQAGEAAVRAAHDIGPATKILVNGAERIPDGLNLGTKVLSEVKNVGSLSYTQQLRDFAQYAGQNGLRFDLYVRPGTELSGPLRQAVSSGEINLLFIP
jgi:hypothetical protein